uniref:IS1634 family transposase n=1 Tax=Streptobacillus canis TaxID=2678686 RepID=UPI0022AEE066|nr:IS1634 family transposase [Streptobacillus canis]
MAEVLRFLVYTRILFQSSKLDNIKYIEQMPDKFKFQLHDIYRALKVFSENKTKILNGVHQFLSHNFNIDKSFTHYDVTNFYMYTDINDEQQYAQYGYSKVNNGKPIVQMGLVTDKNGIPLTYKIFHGNTPDISTLIPFIEEAKKEYNFKNSVIIADAGLISSNNIAEILTTNSSYIIKDRIKNMNADLKAIFEKTIKTTLIEAANKDNDTDRNKVYTYGISIAKNKRVITTINEKNEEVKRNLNLDERYIFFFSPKYKRLLEHNREEVLERTKDNLENQNKMEKKIQKRNKFVKENIQIVNALTGEIVESNLETLKEYELDENSIKEDAKYDGFSLIVTNLDPKENIDSYILETYSKQYQIEHIFRTTKTVLKARPIFVSKNEAIDGHFLTCFLSLLIIMLIRQKLKNKYSIDEIMKTLKEHNYVHITDANECLIDLYNKFRLGDIKKYHTPNTVKQLLANTRENKQRRKKL